MIQELFKKYKWYLALAGVILILALVADYFIRQHLIDERLELIQKQKDSINVLVGEINSLRDIRDSLMVQKVKNSETINNYYTTRVQRPQYKVETNPDSAYYFLKSFSKESR